MTRLGPPLGAGRVPLPPGRECPALRAPHAPLMAASPPPPPHPPSDSRFTPPHGPPGPGLRVSLEVEIPSDVAYIECVVDLVRHTCSELSYNSRQLTLNVPVALSEALSNAILRGNHEDPGKRVRVRAEMDTSRLVLDVVDEGDRFDIDANTRDAADPENLEREDGRGLFLMRALMDRVERFDASPNTTPGNVVRLTMVRA